jgi:hypothetical protein
LFHIDFTAEFADESFVEGVEGHLLNLQHLQLEPFAHICSSHHLHQPLAFGVVEQNTRVSGEVELGHEKYLHDLLLLQALAPSHSFQHISLAELEVEQFQELPFKF